MIRRPPSPTLFPSPPLFRPPLAHADDPGVRRARLLSPPLPALVLRRGLRPPVRPLRQLRRGRRVERRRKRAVRGRSAGDARQVDRKSTRLNSSHLVISYAVF